MEVVVPYREESMQMDTAVIMMDANPEIVAAREELQPEDESIFKLTKFCIQISFAILNKKLKQKCNLFI